MSHDTFGRVIPPAETFNAMPVAMRAECLALLAERAREMGHRRRIDLIESRMHLYVAPPYRLPDAAMAAAPRWIGRDAIWHLAGFTSDEAAGLNGVATKIVADYWPGLATGGMRPRTVRMLAYLAERQPRDEPFFTFDLAQEFFISEETLIGPLKQAERSGFVERVDDFSWRIAPLDNDGSREVAA